jgi:hypothetical protein
LPVPDLFKGIYAIPGAGALAMFLVQMLKDEAAYEKEKELQRKQHFFNLSVTSHMASVAFDKHVEFCESYIACTRRILEDIYKHGSKGSPEIQAALKALIDTRNKYDSWLTDGINSKLINFEVKLKEMIRYTEWATEPGSDKERRKLFAKRAMDLYSIFIRDEDDPEIAPDRIVAHLKSVLGIEELTSLRQAVISEAVKAIESTEKKDS